MADKLDTTAGRSPIDPAGTKRFDFNYRQAANARAKAKTDSQRSAADQLDQVTDESAKKNLKYPSYKSGGIVSNTGLAMMHKGEMVIPSGLLKRSLIKWKLSQQNDKKGI